MKKYNDFINEGGIPGEELDNSSYTFAIILKKQLKITCKPVSRALINDYMFRHNLKDDKYLGIKITLEELPLSSMDEYVKSLQDIKKVLIDLEALEISHGKGKIFAFFLFNDKIKNAIKSDKGINKFKL